jgi:hypothetical protein
VNAGSFTAGFAYQIISLGNTNWTAIGAGVNPQVGQVFTATGVGAGSGTASDCGQCQLVTTGTLASGQMNITFNVNGAVQYASQLTNKYIWDSSVPANRYAVNFFVAGNDNNTNLTSVTITGTGGQVACANTAITTGEPILVSGTLTGSATISGYTNPTTYYVIATNGINTFTLSNLPQGANIITTAGNTRGLTFATEGSTTAKSGADIATWTNGTGNITVAQVSNYTS